MIKPLNFQKLVWLLIALSLLLMACQKEKITVRDVPFDELTASYYVIGANTYEIPIDQVNTLVLDRKDNSVLLADNPIFEGISAGSILVTALGTPTDEVLMRKVLSVDRSGGQLSVITEPARIVEAYSEYYFNSEFEDVYGFKNGSTSLNSIDADASRQMFGPFNDEPESLISIWLNYEFDGKVTFEAIHPHTAYKYFFCAGDQSCFDNIDQRDDNPKNGYYDVVDQAFGNTLIDSLASNGFYTIKYSSFGLKKVGFSIGTKKGDGSSLVFPDNSSVEVLTNTISSSLKRESTKASDDALNLKYVSTPATFWGIFTVTFAMATILDFGFNVAAYTSFDVVFPNRVDIVMGHIDWNNRTIPSGQVDIRITRNGQPESIFHLAKDASTVGSVAFSGDMEARLGLGVGSALSVGEANNAGVSIGALLEAAFYFKTSGVFGARFSDVLALQSGGNMEYFGKMCFDIGLSYDAYLFTDANLGSFAGNFFDGKLRLPKERFGLSNFSFFSGTPGFESGSGVCYGKNGCDTASVEILNFGLDDEDRLGFEYKIVNPPLNNSTYKLKLKTSQGDFQIGNLHNYGEYYSTIITQGKDAIISDILSGKLKVDIEDAIHECNKTFDNKEYGFLVSCADSPYEKNIHGLGSEQEDLVGNTITYFERELAIVHCLQKEARLISEDALKDLLIDRPCVNPTGFLIDNQEGTSKGNSNKAYVWIDQKENGHQIMSIEFEFKPGEVGVPKFKTEAASASLKATAICAGN